MFERPAAMFVPYAGHFPNAPGTAFLFDGTVFATLRIDGAPFEFEPDDARWGRVDTLNNVLRHTSDDAVVVYTHLVRHSSVPPFQGGDGWTSAFARDLHATYSDRALAGLRTNTWFLTIMVRPAAIKARALRFRVREKPSYKVNRNQLRQLEDAVDVVSSTLADYAPRRLTRRLWQAPGTDRPRLYDEIAEALFLIRTGVEMPIPCTHGTMGGAVYADRVIVGPRSFDLNLPGRPRFGGIVSFRNYPHHARPGCLNELLSAPFDLVLSQSLHFIGAARSEAKADLKQSQMENLGDRAKSLQKGLDAAMDDLASGRTATGMHHLSLAVYQDAAARTRQATEAALNMLDRHVGDAMKRLTVFGGANIMQEGRFGAECAYFAQLPGVLAHRTRPGELDTLSFSALSSFDGFPIGRSKGHWGPAICRFRTRGGTAFDYVTHVEDVAHTVITGRTGKGKTALAMFILACLEQSMGPDGVRVIIDKDAGAKIFVELSGGRYLPLRRGQASGLAPLRGLDATPATASFLLNQFRGLIHRDALGPIDPEEERRMARGIAAQMDMPACLRTVAGVREFMGYARNGAGDRFEKWCRGGEMGWVLDNDEHLVDFNAPVQTKLFGFDFTELLPKDESLGDDGACAAAAAVIIHQLRGLMDGRRIAGFFDECRFYLDVLGEVIEDFSLTGRKNEFMVMSAAQEPAHYLRHAAGRSIVGQSATKIAFPDASADIDAYVQGFKFTEAAARQVKSDMAVGNSRRFLLWREQEAAVCEFDLSAMQDELAILSGRPGAVRALDRIQGLGETDRLAAFRQAIRFTRQPAAA